MKSFQKYTAIFIATIFMFLISTNVNAQRNRGNCYRQPAMQQQGQGAGYGFNQPGDRLFAAIPDLSDSQEETIRSLQLEHQKTRLAHRNQMVQLRAQYQNLITAEEVDQSALDEVINQMGNLRTQMMQDRTAHRLEVRDQLNEEQRVVFDSMHHRRGAGFRRGFK